jgi:hypothetical protein
LNRAPAGKGRAVAGEKENTPERAHVKEEEDDKVVLPPVAAKGAAVVVQKAQSEPEKETVVTKTRAPRTGAARGRK